MKCTKCARPLPPDSQYCQYCGTALNPQTGSGTGGKPRGFLWCIALAAGILLAAAMVWGLSLRARNGELETRLAHMEEARNQLEIQLEEAREESSGLRFAADQYDSILSSLQNCDIGFSTANFRSYDSVIVVNRDDRDRKFTLVANWDQPGTVQVSYSGSTASVSFDEPSWEDKTTLTVHPRSVGATVVTFTNDVDSGRFKVLILVTE